MSKIQRPISVPEPTNDVDALWRTTQVLKEVVEIMQGIRGNREVALKCDLDDLSTEVTNNIVTGGGGSNTLAGLADTDLTGQVQYDLLFNSDGVNWEDTDGKLQWNPTNKQLQLTNDSSINWQDSSLNSTELLSFHTDDRFFVGISVYPTELRGRYIGLRNDIGINWDDSSGDNVELANFIPSVGGDEFISQTALLLHFDIADGEMTFKDSSGNENHGRLMGWNDTLTRISSAQSQFGGSSFFVEDASGAHLCVDHRSPDLDFGSNDFTIEWWQRNNTITQTEALICTLESSNGTWCIFQYADNGGEVAMSIRDGTTTIDFGPVRWPAGATVGVWHHKAFVRDGDLIRYFVDGVEQTPTSSAALPASYVFTADNNPIRIGDYNSPLGTAFTFDGYIDELRITNGVARYTSNFTPATAQFADGPSDNTDLNFASVTGMYNFDGVDAATTFTNTGSGPDPTFLGDAALSDTHTLQGTTSLYVSGNNDSCVVLDSGNDGIDDFGTGDFTVEFWFRADSPTNDTTIIARGRDTGNDSGFAYKARYSSNGNSVTLQVGDGTTIYTLPLDVGNPTTPGTRTQQWQHIALVRSGDDLYGFREGVRDLTGWSGGTPSAGWSIPYDTSEKTVVGASWNGTGYQTECKGYVKNLRITKGVARYTADFRPDPLYGDSVVIAGVTTDTFYAGDPAYDTVIEGLTTTVTSDQVTFDATDIYATSAKFWADFGIFGDPGTEGAGITIDGLTFDASLKSSDIGGTRDPQLLLHKHSTTRAPVIIGARSNSDTADHTIVADDMALLNMVATGWDGNEYNWAAGIRMRVDGTPGVGDMPGKIVFETVPDGTNTLTERMLIRADGSIQFLADIVAATPPTTEAVTAQLQFWDADVTDPLSSIGHFGTNDLRIENYMHGGDFHISGQDVSGTEYQIFAAGDVNATFIYKNGKFKLILDDDIIGWYADQATATPPTTEAVQFQHIIYDSTDPFDELAKWGFNGSNELQINNTMHGGDFRITAEDTSGVEQDLFTGDPDGATSLFYAGTSVLSTYATGVSVNTEFSILNGGDSAVFDLDLTDFNSTFVGVTDWNITGATGKYIFDNLTAITKSGGTAADYLHLRDSTDATDLVFRYDGTDWYMRSELAGAGNRYAWFVQSSGAVILFHGNNAIFNTGSAGIDIRGSLGNDPTTGGVQNAQLNFENSTGTEIGDILWQSNVNMYMRNLVHGGNVQLQGQKATGGTTNNLFVGDPDGSASLYFNGELLAETNDFFGVHAFDQRADINTATPPTTETPGVAWRQMDLSGGDILSEMGFFGVNFFTIQNRMHGSEIYMRVEDSGGTVRTPFRVGSASSASAVGFHNTAPIVKPAVTGSRGGNAALASLLTALANYGLITDSST